MCEQNSAFPGTILAIVTTTPENWKGKKKIYIYIVLRIITTLFNQENP